MISSAIASALVQGGFVTALVALVLAFVPAKNATTRYAVWFAALLALAAAPALHVIAAFGVRLWPSPANGGGGGSFSLVALGPVAASAARWTAWPFALGPAVNALLGSVWIAGSAFFLARLVASYVRIGRIRAGAAPAMHIDGVLVLASPHLRIPIATGVFAPAIVVPATLAAVLPGSELQCALEHELAHLRRGDVATNAIQRILEALFFWNPWVHLAGRQLVAQREAACDDVAASRLGASVDYARSLAALGQRLNNHATPLLAPGAFGSRNGLVARIERLASGVPADPKLNYAALGGCIVILSVLTVAVASLAASPVQAEGSAHGVAPAVVAASCKVPNSEVQVTVPVPPELPKSRPSHAVTALVRVTVAPSGKATAASVYRSSGDADVDRAVVTAAEKSTYAPKVVDCKPIQATYLFKATFGP